MFEFTAARLELLSPFDDKAHAVRVAFLGCCIGLYPTLRTDARRACKNLKAGLAARRSRVLLIATSATRGIAADARDGERRPVRAKRAASRVRQPMRPDPEANPVRWRTLSWDIQTVGPTITEPVRRSSSAPNMLRKSNRGTPIHSTTTVGGDQCTGVTVRQERISFDPRERRPAREWELVRRKRASHDISRWFVDPGKRRGR
jgi:hypothetical protein